LGLILTFILVDAVIDKFLIFGRKAHKDEERLRNPGNGSRELSDFTESKPAEQGNDAVRLQEAPNSSSEADLESGLSRRALK
jgi:hypothetical protein